MTLKELINKFNTFTEDKNYLSKPPVGLLSPAFSHEFNVSAGHDYANEIFESNELILTPIKYSLIDTCFRRIDMERVGFSNSHLSLFFIALFALGLRKEYMESHIKYLIRDYIEFLTGMLEIPNDKILITVFNGGNILNFNLDKEILLIEALKEAGIDESRILALNGRRNFFYAQNVECSGPTCEIYYNINQKGCSNLNYIEIGSINYYKYINKNNSLSISPNQVFACGIGLERTLMALQNKSNICDIDVISPLIGIVNKALSSPFEQIIFSSSIRSIIDNVRSAIFILSEGINPDNSSRGRLLKKILKNIINQMKYLYLFDYKIISELEDSITEIYADSYPQLKQKRINLITMITDKFQKE